MITYILIVVIIVLIYFIYYNKTPALPPGPTGLPIVGNVFCFGPESHLILNEFARTYGYEFTDYGPVWKKHRQFISKSLRKLMSHNLEEAIHVEIGNLVHAIAEQDGRPFNVVHVITSAVAGVMYFLIFGSRYDYSDDANKRVVRQINKLFRINSRSSISNYFPTLVHLPFVDREYKQVNKEINDFINRKIEGLRLTFDPNKVQGFLDMYLAEMREQQTRKDDVVFSDFFLYRSIRDLFTSGIETPATTLLWALLYMATNISIQEKVQAEIDDVIGKDRLPSIADRNYLPFVMATIMEIQRHSSVAFIVRRCTMDDVDFHGYTIPRGNIYSLRLGFQHVVVLSGCDVIKEAFGRKNEYFAGRPKTGLIRKVVKGAELLERNRKIDFRRSIFVQAEIDDVIGKDRLPSIADRNYLPFVMATIMEIQRHSSVAFIVRRCTMDDVDFHGYTIPRGTHVLMNIRSTHYDKKFWNEPENFNPERFLDCEGKLIRNHSAFVPFGKGGRACLGEKLAKMELFIFFTALLQNYTFTVPDDKPSPSLKAQVGINLFPEAFEVCATRRG
ncbi:cytochrome P450 2U1-like [Saccoglossus kowalevskii]